MSTLRKASGEATTRLEDTARVFLDAHVPNDSVDEENDDHKTIRKTSERKYEGEICLEFVEKEVAIFLKSMKNGKSPGEDLIKEGV